MSSPSAAAALERTRPNALLNGFSSMTRARLLPHNGEEPGLHARVLDTIGNESQIHSHIHTRACRSLDTNHARQGLTLGNMLSPLRLTVVSPT